MCLSLARHVSHLFQLGETCVSPFSIPGSNTVGNAFSSYLLPQSALKFHETKSRIAAAVKYLTFGLLWTLVASLDRIRHL